MEKYLVKISPVTTWKTCMCPEHCNFSRNESYYDYVEYYQAFCEKYYDKEIKQDLAYSQAENQGNEGVLDFKGLIGSKEY